MDISKLSRAWNSSDRSFLLQYFFIPMSLCAITISFGEPQPKVLTPKISLRHHSPFTQIEEIKTSLSKSILTWVAPYLGVLLPSTYTLHICLHVNNKCRNPDFCLFKTFMGGGYCRNTEDVIKGERSYIQWTWSKWLKCSKITSFCFMKLMLALLQKYPFLMPYIFFKDIDQILITSFLKEFLDSR